MAMDLPRGGMTKGTDFPLNKTYHTKVRTKGHPDEGEELTTEQAIMYAMTPLPFISYGMRLGLGMLNMFMGRKP